MEPTNIIIVLARRYQKLLTLILVPPDMTLPLLSSILVPFSLSRPDFPLKKAMSLNTEAPRPQSAAPPRLKLSAHTDGANTLAEQLFHGKISQKDYNAHIYSTTISSVTSVPITLTMEDSLATLIAYAHQSFRIPLAKVKTTKLYVLWSKNIVGAIGSQSVPENLNSLKQDTLHMALTFMKASPQVEKLLVRFEHPLAEIAAKHTTEVDQAAAKDDIPAPKPYSSNATDRSYLIPKEQSASKKGKEQERPSGNHRNVQDSVQAYQRSLGLIFYKDKPRVSDEKQEDTKQAPQAKGEETRRPGSASDASNGSHKSRL